MTVITRTEPDDSERLRRSLSKEQGPTDEQRDASLGFGPRSRGFGQDQDPTSVSFPFLRRIAKDHGVAMGLHYTESPLLRAQWYISAGDARAASFADNLIRPIYGSTVSAVLRFLWAGFSPAVKNTVAVNPSWTYVVDGEVRQVWPSTAVDALVYKPLKILAPEACRLVYDDNGAWNGIQWDEHYVGAGGFVISGRQRPNIDLSHSFWATLGAETVDGDPYGFARVAYCAPIFHMYRYIWTLLAHAFENSADPGPEVYFPKDENKDEDDETNRETALRIGRRKRSGSTVAIPSDVYEDFQNRTTNIPKWRIEYSDVKTEFAPIQEFLAYLETLKFRSLMISEQSLSEGQGGSCLVPETPIICPRDHLLYPLGVPLSEIEPGRMIWCFNEKTELFELHPVKRVWKTMDDADLYRATLDDGSEIIGTSNHPFMSRDGVWRRLDELKPGDRLMPFYEGGRFCLSSGDIAQPGDYEPMVCIDPDGGTLAFEYLEVGKHLQDPEEPGKINVHHVDERHANTSFDNLIKLTASQHHRVHFDDPYFKKRHSDAVKEAMKNLSPEARARLRKEHWTEEDRKRYSEQQRIVGIKSMDDFRSRIGEIDYDEFVKRRNRNAFKTRLKKNGSARIIPVNEKSCKKCGTMFLPDTSRRDYCPPCVPKKRQPYSGRTKNPGVYKPKNCFECGSSFIPRSGKQKFCDEHLTTASRMVPNNHRVVSVERVGRTGEVWDIEMDAPDHCKNFVAAGVVVHNSSRNVAQVMSSQRDSAQASLMDLVIKVIMDQLVRPAMAINMPWYEGPLEMKTIGFGKEDNDVVRQMFQLAGQKDLSEFGIDLRRLADSRGFPMLDHAEQERMKKRMIAQADATRTPAVEPTQGRRALVTQSGFGEMVYHQLHDRIDLSSMEDGDFVASLPRSATWEDRGVLDAARELRGHLADAERRSDKVNLTDLVVDVQRCLYRAYDSALETTARALSGAPIKRSSFTSEDLDRRSRAIVGELLDVSRFDGASGLAVREIAAARNRAVVEVCMLDDVAVQVLENGPERGRVFKPADAIGLGEVRPLAKAPESLEIRRERLDGEHMARYDEDAGVVLLSVDLPPEQEADFMIALGDRMAA